MVAGLAATNLNTHFAYQLKQIAELNHLPFTLLQKESLTQKINNWLKQTNPDIVFVFSFPFRIPEPVLNIPNSGFVNFHPSILPAYRGPDPLFWQIKNGEDETAITAHKMIKEFDSGPIIRIEKEKISKTDTYGILTNKLSYTLMKCAGNVINILSENRGGQFFFNQDNEEATYFKRPSEDDLKIDWQKMTSREINNLVKACNPNYQGAVTTFRNYQVRILETVVDYQQTEGKPGEIIEADNNSLCTATRDNKSLRINVIYLQEGVFGSSHFNKIFQVKPGEMFV